MYPPVNKHSNGKSPSWIGNTSSNGGFSIAMFVYRRVSLFFGNTYIAASAGETVLRQGIKDLERGDTSPEGCALDKKKSYTTDVPPNSSSVFQKYLQGRPPYQI